MTDVLGHVSDRWSLPVLVMLISGPMRFNQLRREVRGVSQQMLSRTLKGLARDGMVSRTVIPAIPPQVEYALTPLGLALAQQGRDLGDWASEHLAEIDARRAEFDGDGV